MPCALSAHSLARAAEGCEPLSHTELRVACGWRPLPGHRQWDSVVDGVESDSGSEGGGGDGLVAMMDWRRRRQLRR